MCFHFLYTVQVDNVYQNVLDNSCLFLFLRHGIQKIKEHILHKWGFTVFSNWFDFIYYIEIIFLSKNVTFLYILKIFFTMLHLKIFLEYWVTVYFQNIVVCNERFIQKSFLGAKNVIFLYILKIFFTVLG